MDDTPYKAGTYVYHMKNYQCSLLTDGSFDWLDEVLRQRKVVKKAKRTRQSSINLTPCDMQFINVFKFYSLHTIKFSHDSTIVAPRLTPQCF